MHQKLKMERQFNDNETRKTHGNHSSYTNMMLSSLKLRMTQNRSLLIAAFISIVLHLLLIGNYSISLPSNVDTISAIHARLIQSLPEQQLNTSAISLHNPPVPTSPRRTKPSSLQKPSAIDSPLEESKIEKAEAPTMPTIAPEETPKAMEPNTPNNADPLLDVDKQQLTEGNDNSTTAIEPSENVNTHTTMAYPYVQSEFEVTRGEGSSILGNTQMTFLMNTRDNTYQLSSVTEAKGVASLFLSKLEQHSEGSVDEKGLKPYYYAYQYGTNSDKNQYAKLLWENSVIEMTSKKGKKTEKLPEGTQDFLSFMYQFMFTPPLNSMQITMTNGKYLRTYTYSFEGEETISTKLGELKTLHLLKSGDNLEKTEIWLALDYQNIPVKIRKTEKDGSVIEQIIVMLKTTH